MAAPPFSLSPPASHSPHVSTTVCPAIYAIAIAAIGQVTSTAPVAAAAPTTGVTPSLRRADFLPYPPATTDAYSEPVVYA